MAAFDHGVLGYPLSTGYNFTFGRKLKEWPLRGGTRRLRLHDKFASYEVPAEFVWTESQFDFFSSWYENDLNGGSLPFDMELITGVGLKVQTCLIQNGYQYARAGDTVRVNIDITVKRDPSLLELPVLKEIYDIINAGIASINPAPEIIDAGFITANDITQLDVIDAGLGGSMV